jgi:hypothetical protein
MKALSIWQPWACLIISRHKKIETRGWPAPHSIRGKRIVIASTKTIRREQRLAARELAFQVHYSMTGLPLIDDLPMGCILGTVMVKNCRAIGPDLMQALEPAEEAFGRYAPGRFGWLLRDPQPLLSPIPVRGGQGL